MSQNVENERASRTTPHASDPQHAARDAAATLLALAERVPYSAWLCLAAVHRRRFLAAFLALAGLLLAANGASANDADIAVRAEGYVGYTRLDLFQQFDGVQGGGAGSLSAVFDAFYIQANVFGESTDFDDDVETSAVGPGLHLGWRRQEAGSLGVVATYNRLDRGGNPFDAYRVGLESEVFLDAWTLGLNGGYFGQSGTGSGYIDALFAAYPTDRVRVNGRVGVLDFESGSPLVLFGAGAEVLAADAIAPFVRWEASVPDNFEDALQHSIVAGLTLYWGAERPSLKTFDRHHFKPSCVGIQLAGRAC